MDPPVGFSLCEPVPTEYSERGDCEKARPALLRLIFRYATTTLILFEDPNQSHFGPGSQADIG
jgi:hypothetical protein